jgi:hypothetical protein
MDHSAFFKKELNKIVKEDFPEDEISESLELVVEEINIRLDDKDYKNLSEALDTSIGYHFDDNAKNKIMKGDTSGWHLIERETYWLAHMITHVKDAYSSNDRMYGGTLGMCLLWGYDKEAAAVAAVAEKTFSGNKVFYSTERFIHVFMAALSKKAITGSWPAFTDLIPKDHIYQRLIAAWNDESAFAQLMLEACDYHIYSIYDDGGNKANEILAFEFIPFDIRSIEFVRAKEGLPNAQIDHPLMQTPLAAIPAERPGYDPAGDEILQLVIKHEK